VEKYTPAFSVTNNMLMLAAEISEKTGRITSCHSFETKPHLCRNNRIRSIYSSLAAEDNSLSPDEIKNVIDAKTVLKPEKEIQEVKNAYQAYDMLGTFDPYSLCDMQKMHGIMTNLILQESGVYRSHSEVVFIGDECIFMASPPVSVPGKMKGLFDWMKENTDSVHPLILSSVFHYELVMIHPFSDGNGIMARFWQTALLSDWRSVFQYIPLESKIYDFMEEYYEAIAACHSSGILNDFIEFMLDKINMAMDMVLEQLSEKDAYLAVSVQKLLEIMEYDTPYTAIQLMNRLNLRSKVNFRRLYLIPALEKGLVVMGIPDKPTSRNQTYIRK